MLLQGTKTYVAMETPTPHPGELALKGYQHICLSVIACAIYKIVQAAHLHFVTM